MNLTRETEPVSFFLATAAGRLYCIYHPPKGQKFRGAVLYCPPFLEEMNKSRRMTALQARHFADNGVGVLLMDLYGCGDSEGRLRGADWELWKQNIADGCSWLQERTKQSISLWGLRLGCLLALDFARGAGSEIANYLLWQPALSGETVISQFLRLRVAADMIGDGIPAAGTAALRERISAGETLEVAGYELNHRLAAGLERLKLADLRPPSGAVHWFDVSAGAGRDLPPAARRVIDAFRDAAVEVNVAMLTGEPFWTTQEITECPQLIEATTKVFTRGDKNL